MSNDFDEQLAAVARTASQVAVTCQGKTVHDVLGAFADVGLLGAIATEDAGGLSLPVGFAAAIVGAAAGELMADPLPETLVCARYAGTLDQALASAIAAGDVFATLSLHEGLSVSRRDARLTVRGQLPNVVFGQQARYLLAVATHDAAPALVLLDLEAAGVERVGAETLDLERARAHLRFDEVELAAEHVSTDAAEVQGFRNTTTLLYSQWLRSQVAACLSSTSAYLSSRRQFGQPLSSLQVVRFSLAQMALELENLRLMLQAADGASGVSSLSADMAYAYAAEVCPGISEKCLHLNGGMGFTWEVPIHRYLRRIRAMTDDHGAASAREAVASLTLGIVPRCKQGKTKNGK